MTTKIILIAFGSLALGTTVIAQTKELPKKEPQENIIIRKKADPKEKITIVIDGDNITINGKPLSEMKDADIQVLRNKGIAPLLPRIRARIAPMGGSMKMFGNGGPISAGNDALLGVISEKDEKGAKITSVTKESAAEKAGLQKDDIITKIDDSHVIQNGEDLYNAIGSYHAGDKVAITYLRDGKEAITSAVLDKNNTASNIRSFGFNDRDFNFKMPDMPELNNFDFNFNTKPKLGLEIQDLEEGKGVKVLDATMDAPGAKAGLQKDDIITEVNGAGINSVDGLKERLRNLKEGDHVKITYQRKGKTGTADVHFPKRLKTADL